MWKKASRIKRSFVKEKEHDKRAINLRLSYHVEKKFGGGKEAS